jgi:hypothetical protein
VYFTFAYRDKKVVGVFVRFSCAASCTKHGDKKRRDNVAGGSVYLEAPPRYGVTAAV